jgi:hypothetical protein
MPQQRRRIQHEKTFQERLADEAQRSVDRRPRMGALD